ncbi:hypothetical protein Tco_1504089 [Tanacetum coccineum]
MFPQRHFTGDMFPQRHVAGEGVRMLLGKASNVVVNLLAYLIDGRSYLCFHKMKWKKWNCGKQRMGWWKALGCLNRSSPPAYEPLMDNAPLNLGAVSFKITRHADPCDAYGLCLIVER